MKSLLIITFLFVADAASAQSKSNSPVCKPAYDSTQAIELILSKYDSARVPVAEFDKLECKWSVSFFTAAYTKKDNCAHPIGCTVMTFYLASLDARTGKVEVEKTGRKTVPLGE